MKSVEGIVLYVMRLVMHIFIGFLNMILVFLFIIIFVAARRGRVIISRRVLLLLLENWRRRPEKLRRTQHELIQRRRYLLRYLGLRRIRLLRRVERSDSASIRNGGTLIRRYRKACRDLERGVLKLAWGLLSPPVAP